MEIVAGSYSGTYDGLNVGITETGYRLSHELFKQLITGDASGQTPIEAIYQGRAQFVNFTVQEFNADAVPSLTEPYSIDPATGNHDPGLVGAVGQQDVGNDTCPGVAKPLILTALPGVCAASRGPATITFPKAILAEGFPVDVLYGPQHRMVPLRLRVYPVDGRFYTVT